VINVLRQSTLPGVDMRDAAGVAAYLNAVFPMESHGDMYLTLWYGVYDLGARSLAYCSAGHHPSYLVAATREEALPLKTRNVAVGIRRATRGSPRTASTSRPEAASTYSATASSRSTLPTAASSALDAVAGLLLEPPVAGKAEPERLLEAIRARTAGADFDDDFTLVVATFP
jgi:hypothetical protein